MAENRELALVLKLVADEFQRELRNSQSQLSVFNNFIKDWKTQLVAAGTALFAVAKSTANFGEEALKGAQKIGTTVETYTALAHAAKMADLDNQQLIIGMKSLAQNMVEASRQTGDGDRLFRQLGVSAVNAAGQLRPTQQVLLDLADVFAKSADGAGKTEAAVKLFGKAGIDLIPFLNQGKAGIQALMDEAKKLGVVMSTEDAQAANRFNDEIKKLDAQMQGMTLSVGSVVIPMLTDMVKLLREVGDVTKKAGEEMAGFSKHLSDNFGKSGVGQGLMDLFSAMGFGHRKGEGPGSTEKALLDALGIKPGGASGAGSGSDVKMEMIGQQTSKQLKDDAKLALALNDIWQVGIRSLETQKRLLAEAAEAQRQVAEAAEDAAIQEALGRWGVADGQRKVREREQIQLGQQRLQQAQAQLAIDEQLRRESMTFFDHWKEGLQQYVQDTKSGFGLAADLARRTAQMMEQSFKTFFFDLFNGRIKSLEDALEGVLNFITQIASTIASQLATKAVLGAFGFSGANAGGMIQRFAAGGPVLGTGNRDTVPALLTPGEFVLSRQDVGEIKRGIGGGPQIIIHNYGQNEVSATSGRGPDGRQAIQVTIRDMVRGMIKGGEMDASMGYRFGLNPTGGRR